MSFVIVQTSINVISVSLTNIFIFEVFNKYGFLFLGVRNSKLCILLLFDGLPCYFFFNSVGGESDSSVVLCSFLVLLKSVLRAIQCMKHISADCNCPYGSFCDAI
jgi:hypothetical protein